MSDEKDLEQLKKEAAAKAKAAALAKMKAKSSEGSTDEETEDIAKQKAAAVAKAKAAALAKMKAKSSEGSTSEETEDIAKQKAAAAAKAKAAALAKMKAKSTEGPTSEETTKDIAKQKAAAAAKAKAAALAKAAAKAKSSVGDDAKAKAIAAAKAKAAAAAAAKTKGTKKSTNAVEATEERKPSPNQPYLDKYVKVIEEHLGKEVLEDSYINPLSKDVPTLVAYPNTYYKVAEFLKYNEQLGFDYLSDLHGTDFQTHIEIYVHFYSYKNRQSVALKVKIDRDEPEIDSLQPLWAGVDWTECETYDLLGVKFKGHPNLHRILLGEDWVGHPLRKDYEPYDVEV
ncbi:NADH-quinone oxidoreductase subunit C [Bacillus aquiflavi]|uniref:NADH-quinone oxidoreductase subunit C n=1 Tax=Bacillus aquiflavi TaxID=2672567 RepID=UPI001CA8FF7A|nr:NADH-quinone oxidoreductase subunit C [Bacillus aquiflavi]UAC47914.1 NADH-quinone oxidoreductase subunit C [Bacillus aquiflavi]